MLPDIGNLANEIQLALTPAFLLSGIAALLSVMTGRLARIVDCGRWLGLHQELIAAGYGMREAGITGHLTKPFAPEELLECVREALDKSQMRRGIPKS